MTFSNMKYKDIIGLEVAILKIIDINNTIYATMMGNIIFNEVSVIFNYFFFQYRFCFNKIY